MPSPLARMSGAMGAVVVGDDYAPGRKLAILSGRSALPFAGWQCGSALTVRDCTTPTWDADDCAYLCRPPWWSADRWSSYTRYATGTWDADVVSPPNLTVLSSPRLVELYTVH